MINELINILPSLSFGFGRATKTVEAGQPVTVWLATLYSPGAYTFSLTANQGMVTKISDYEYEVTYNNPGMYEISLTVSAQGKKTSLQSNTITLNVV